MAQLREGGCQCGGIRYRFGVKPLTLYVCHCEDCQKQSSSAFGMSLRLPRAALEIISGEPRFHHSKADSGKRKIGAFCPDCGTRLYHAASHDSETLNVKAGSLDDTRWLRPVGHLWTRSAQPWVPIDRDGMLAYEGQPDNFDDLLARYQAS